MTYLLFSCGLMLSAVAAYYSVMGLIAIFSTAVIPIAIMGSVLEVSKLVSASWLYRNWNTIPKLLKTYFTTAVVVLMLLTSMGIFGYLSKAHLDQAVPTGDVASKIAILDEKIKTEKDNVDAARKAITQLDSQVDQTLARTTDDRGADRSVAIRRSQAKERANLLSEIQASQAKIAKLNEERAPIASELRKVEAEVGPIKYIAALIYGDDKLDDTLLEKSVRIVILMIVFVFDPLAVLLLIAANREILVKKPEEDDEEEYEYKGPHATGTDNPVDFPMVHTNPHVTTWTSTTTYGEPEEEPNPAVWESVVSGLEKEPEETKEETTIELAPINPEPDTKGWMIHEPPKETPEEFKKVVKDYFHPEEPIGETMLYVNEEPEREMTFVLDPKFDEQNPFMEKKPAPPVRPNSRRTPTDE
jgi:hypothetical protein